MRPPKLVTLALVFLHVSWMVAPAVADPFGMPPAEAMPLYDTPGMDQLVDQYPELDEALQHVASGLGSDLDGSPRIWRLALMEGLGQLDEWTAPPGEWLPLFATEYGGQATLFSACPKPGEEDVFQVTWTYADGTPVTGPTGQVVSDIEATIEGDGADASILLGIVFGVALFCATFDVSYTYHGDNWDFEIGC